MSFRVWLVEAIKKTFSTRFTMARGTHVPIIGKAVDRLLFDGDDILYLPKDNVIQVDERIEGRNDVVLPSSVVEHFIQEAEYLWIMNNCICRDANSCKDYPIDLGCLFMGEAAMKIDPHLGRQVSREEALEHVKRCREAGLVHLIGRNKLDTVWLGVGPGDKLLTVCNCCPCCCLWKMLPEITPLIGDKVSRMPGVKVEVTEDCEGCGACTEDFCFVDAISLADSRAVISDACRGCGRCADACPNGAIKISIKDVSYISHTIDRISGLVDLK